MAAFADAISAALIGVVAAAIPSRFDFGERVEGRPAADGRWRYMTANAYSVDSVDAVVYAYAPLSEADGFWLAPAPEPEPAPAPEPEPAPAPEVEPARSPWWKFWAR
ncbi:hypothetical protein D9V32_05450 [Mycetocola tolaasinivorans]|uniref:Uncharacterized protein n=1 Tax=Mycetocola tolaasinivorans TaxID=76635 RepID=A0A3L7A892_9MICO|nr:hypothetical protein [Mycetocola tolaasinivorans]RLP76315.1 hypothetical protein D9V32_05450 [Mycetocola tolaasinivorans]